MQTVCKWLVKEGIAGDLEKAAATIEHEVGKLRQQKEGLITSEEFGRLFTKGVLKKALVDVADRFGKMVTSGEDASQLGRKIQQYSRSHVI